jgi:hypothetical protein
MSFQTLLTNHTPFASEKFVLPTPDGQEAVLIVLAATFEAKGGASLAPCEKQPPVLAEDLYAGDPASSSLLAENELALSKRLVDVVVVGTAYAPRGKPAEKVAIGLQIGDVNKSLWVSGHRIWALRSPTRPVPFEKMPIRYERAFGGTNPQNGNSFRSNPVGVGFKGAVSNDALKAAIPNVEYADATVQSPSDQPRPAGLTPIARSWAPRASFGGTYDDKWLDNRWPLLPLNFDSRFNQITPPDQQSATIRGGERIRLVHLTPDGLWEFALPRLDVPVQLVYDKRDAVGALRLDTVVIEPDARRVRMTSRLCLVTERGTGLLREIVLGHVTRGWLTSMRQRKTYLDFGRTGGANRGVPSYHL